MTRLYLADESLAPGNGGICRVARMVARAAVELGKAEGFGVDAQVLSDKVPPTDLGLSIVSAHNSRLKYVARNYAAALTHSHFFYDFVGMARAHPKFPRRPFMTMIHGIEVWEETRPDRLQWARRADMLLVNTAYTRQRADQLHGGLSHARVCWLATEEDDAPAGPLRIDGPPTVLIVGRIDEGRYKGHIALIENWDKVVAAVPEARLVIVGKGPGAESIKQLASRQKSAGQIEFAGFVPDEKMPDIWRRGTVFAMPSRGEGFGLVYIEAMRYGLPVIASVHDAAGEVNIDQQTGYNVNLDQPAELLERLIALLRDRDLAGRMGMAGQDRWREQFRYSSFRDRFIPLLREFMKM